MLVLSLLDSLLTYWGFHHVTLSGLPSIPKVDDCSPFGEQLPKNIVIKNGMDCHAPKSGRLI